MKKRIVSMALILILLIGVLAIPSSAATPNDVYNYLKNLAMSGSNASGLWFYNFILDDSTGETLYYGVFYDESSKTSLCAIYTTQFEITLELPPTPQLPYRVFMMIYDDQETTGMVQINGNYNGSEFSAFSSFSGNTDYTTNMLRTVNTAIPMILELTRLMIYDGGYTLADLKLNSYQLCRFYHCSNNGVVTKAPTCGVPGTKTYSCAVCNAALKTEELAPTGAHVYNSTGVTVIPAGCLTSGTVRYTCTGCSATRDETLPALGHNWDNGVQNPAPTCTQSGALVRTCTRCQAQSTETLSALGHAYTLTEVLTEPTDENEHGTARYTCSRCSETKEAALCAGEVFTDMPAEGSWAHAPIDWAWLNGITNGMSATTFAPNVICNRAQVVTFLWNAAGKPEPKSMENPFADVLEGTFYYKAVIWAVENGITNGMTATTFAPKATCNRAQVVTFLWNAAGKPEPESEETVFTDLEEGRFYYKPVLWAASCGITNGTSATTFSPLNPCTRAQVVTLLYNALHLPEPETPEDPTDPIPEDPTDPIPEDPTDPIPEDPTDPAPEDPTDPAPEDPTDPAPEDPTDPAPEDPIDPITPEDPIEP